MDKKSSKSYLLEDPERFSSESIRLITQAKELFLLEKPLYHEHGVIAPRTIFEIGCGNGAYLSAVSSLFPDALISGLDMNEGLLQQAANLIPKAHLIHGNATNSNDLSNALKIIRPDTIIVRLVLQHLFPWEISVILKTILEKKMPKTTVLLIDTDDRYFSATPHCTFFERLLKQKGAHQFQAGGDRNVGTKLPSLLLAHGFEHIKSSQVLVDSSNIGMEKWLNVFWPVLKSGTKGLSTVEANGLLRGAEEWIQSATNNALYKAQFSLFISSTNSGS